MTDEQKAEHLRALIEERRGYELAGKTERVALVDVEIKRFGGEAKAPAKRAQTRKA